MGNPTHSTDQGSETGSIQLVADLVSAYVSNNRIPRAELPVLIGNVHAALNGITSCAPQAVEDEVQKPTASQIRKSISPNVLISFIDGRPYKTLKRHLLAHGLSPYSYRQRYGLPNDYPMVAPSYAARRSEIAKSIGLGRPRGMA